MGSVAPGEIIGTWNPIVIGYEAFTFTELDGPMITLTPAAIWLQTRNKKVFQLKTNYPLVNRLFAIYTGLNVVGGGERSQFGGNMRGPKWTSSNRSMREEVPHVTCDCPMVSWVVVTWDLLSTDRQTRLITLPSYKLRMLAVTIIWSSRQWRVQDFP